MITYLWLCDSNIDVPKEENVAPTSRGCVVVFDINSIIVERTEKRLLNFGFAFRTSDIWHSYDRNSPDTQEMAVSVRLLPNTFLNFGYITKPIA